MKKQVTVVMIVESEDEINMSDCFIRQDLEQEIACASNYYEIVDIKTEVINEMDELTKKNVEYLDWYFTYDDGVADKAAQKAWFELRELITNESTIHHSESN